MKTKPVLRQHHRAGKATTLLLIIALVGAVVGCVEDAVFDYDLTISASEGGSVTSPGEGPFTYEYGTVVNLVAEAAPGHRFVNWSGSVGTVEDIEAAETTITMNGDYSIAANFEQIPIVKCDLSVSSTAGGSVIAPGNGVFTYDTDTVVNLVAVADECYEFVNWSGDGVSDPYSSNTTISIAIGEEATRSVTANFARLRYVLTTNSTGYGSVTMPGEGTSTYDCGTAVSLVARPDMRCRFAGWSGDVDGIDDVHAAEITLTMDGNRSLTATFEVIPMVTAGIWHTVGLKSDGTVLATGYNASGQCGVEDWTGIVQVAAGERHTVGLMADGTVVAAGTNDEGECNVGYWTDIVQIDAGRYHTVGLKSDGTLVAVGRNKSGQLNIEEWTGIGQVATGFYHTIGLRPDGTVVAVGHTGEGRLEVGEWSDIVQVGAGGHHTLGLKSDGTVVAVGRNNYRETNVDWWTDIVQVAGGCQASVGLKADGSVVQSGWCESGQCYVQSWSDIVQVGAGIVHTVGLRADGTVVSAGSNGSGQRNVGDWMLGAAGG